MPNDLKQDAAGVKLGHAPRRNPAGLALQMRLVGIVDAGTSGALDFAANRAGRTAKTSSNGPNGAQVVAHGHDDCALLGSQMFVDFRHGGTLQEKVLHLVFENAVDRTLAAPCFPSEYVSFRPGQVRMIYGLLGLPSNLSRPQENEWCL